jgi:hypothetical protein
MPYLVNSLLNLKVFTRQVWQLILIGQASGDVLMERYDQQIIFNGIKPEPMALERSPKKDNHVKHPLRPCPEAIWRRDCNQLQKDLSDAWRRSQIETMWKLLKIFMMTHNLERDVEGKLVYYRKELWADDKKECLQKIARRII